MPGSDSPRGKVLTAVGIALALQSSACTSCLTRGTRVATPLGPRGIEDLRPGDRVWSYDVDRGLLVERAVLAATRALRPDVLAIRAGERRIGGVTPDHPVFDAAVGRFVDAGDLSIRSVLVAFVDGAARRTPVEVVERRPLADPVEVWDVSIEGPEHNFFADGILVHNKSRIWEGRPDAAIDAHIDADDDGGDDGSVADADTDAGVDGGDDGDVVDADME